MSKTIKCVWRKVVSGKAYHVHGVAHSTVKMSVPARIKCNFSIFP
jgi:hypothetical protein